MAHFDRCSVESGGNRKLSIALATPFDDFQYGNGSKIEIDAFISSPSPLRSPRFSSRKQVKSTKSTLPLSLQIGLPSRLSLPARLPPPPSFIEGAQETKHRREAASGASGMALRRGGQPAGRLQSIPFCGDGGVWCVGNWEIRHNVAEARRWSTVQSTTRLAKAASRTFETGDAVRPLCV